MASKKVFKVSFKGVILPGFDKNQVIENVHDITRIPKQTITRKFFSGKTVVIRHADSQDYASRLQKTFAQAGIETYIDEFTETVSDDESIDTGVVTQNSEAVPVHDPNTVESPSNTHKSNHLKIITVIAAMFILALITLFFMNSENQSDTDVTHQATQQLSSPKQQQKTVTSTTKKEKTSEDINKKQVLVTPPTQIPLASKESTLATDESVHLINKDEISGLIKITDKSELKQLQQFSPLLGIKSNLFGIINGNLNSSMIISEQTPLYLFNKRDKTEFQFSLLITIDKSIPKALVNKLNTELNNTEWNQNKLNLSCTPNQVIKALIVNDYLLVTTIDDKQLADFERVLKDNKIASSLQKLDSLFVQSKEPVDEKTKTTFNLYYQNNAKQTFFQLSSNNENYWLSLDKDSLKQIQGLLKQLNIDTEKSNNHSTIKTINLYNQSLLLIAHQRKIFNNRQLLTRPSDGNPFQTEQIVKIVKSYSDNDIQNYKDQLDIELSAQWQSGPFAITTNQFKFNKNLSIELLAKGQNIKNLMEYSQSAFLQIDSVLNQKNINILRPDCAPHKAYFKDIDGEQEAYIDDDFISYQTITAKQAVNIVPGFNNFDIDLIEGEVALTLPTKIQQEAIKLQKTHLHTQIHDFSLMVKHTPKTNTLNFGVIGNTDQFITIRAYNYSGDVIETLFMTQKAYFNDKVISYRQTFAEPIEVIKAFYTKENKTIKYPFKFKPEILPVKNQTESFEENEISSTDNELIPYIPGKLDLIPLKKKIQEDNPEWLGTKWSSEKITQKVTSPFYINLFMHKSDGTKIDSVLNIKSSLSAFISQNITAVKLTLLDDTKILIDNFISFNISEHFDGESEGELEVDGEGQIIPPQMTLYLNSSSAFEINNQLPAKSKNTQSQMHGHLTLSLPTAFKTHSKKYTALGQIIKLDGLFIKTVQLNKHQIQFEIRGNIKDLVQLKLYSKKNKLISQPFEFSHLEKNKALITLLYNDEIDTVKLVLSQNTTFEEYPFSFSK